MLSEVALIPSDQPVPSSVEVFIQEALQRAKTIDCFDFIPSNYRVVYTVLRTLPPARFCEWGSGMGVVTGLARMLGFDAYGIELNTDLVAASRGLLAEYGLAAHIEAGDYLESRYQADVYFTYCWPGQFRRVEEHFDTIAPDHARLLICYGAEDVRCKRKGCA